MTPRHRLRGLLLRAAALVLRLAARRRDSPTNAAPRRLLLIRPDHLGDLLFLTPALRRLRVQRPDAAIWLASGAWGLPVLAGNTDLDGLLPIDFPGFTRRPKGNPLAPYTYLPRVARELRRYDFDAAVILRDDHWWGALLAAAAGIPRRFGYALPDVAPFLTDALLPSPTHQHTTVTNGVLLDAVAATGPAQPAPPLASLPFVLPTTPRDEARAATLLARLPQTTARTPIVAIHANPGAPVKFWDEGRLAAVADHLATEFGARIVLTGGPGDAAITADVARRMRRPALDLAGQTSVGTLAALYWHCALVLGPDSGALHIASAAGTPTVRLYGPADPRRFGPWGNPALHRVASAGLSCDRCGDLSPQRPRGAACMLAIEVDDVLRAARPLLAGWPAQ